MPRTQGRSDVQVVVEGESTDDESESDDASDMDDDEISHQL